MQSINGGAYSNISGATSASYTTAATTVANSGTQFECVIANAEGRSTSNAASLTVNPAPPVVSITSPATGSTFNSGSNITFIANASEVNGSIVNVSYYSGSTLLGTATGSPYSYTWSNVAIGTYSITAIATDSYGVSVTSGQITITVVPQVIIGRPR
jgi:hypothetical protein